MTVTLQQPEATFYAACAADNLVGEIYDSAIGQNGNLTQAYVQLGSNVGNQRAQKVLTTDNSYDCCVQCLTDDNCGGGYFQTDGTNVCVLADTQYQDDCDPNLQALSTYTSGDMQPFSAVTVFDGNCGQVSQMYFWDG